MVDLSIINNVEAQKVCGGRVFIRDFVHILVDKFNYPFLERGLIFSVLKKGIHWNNAVLDIEGGGNSLSFDQTFGYEI